MSALGELSKMKRRTTPKTAAEKKDEGRDNKAAYIFLLPWLIGLLFITVGPMLASLYLSFTDYNLLQSPNWIGLENFTRMLGDTRLHNSLGVTFTYVLVGVPIQLAVALLIALVLTRASGDCRSTGQCFTCRPCWAVPWRLPFCGSRFSAPRGWSTKSLPWLAFRGRAGSRTRARPWVPSSCCTCGRLVRR